MYSKYGLKLIRFAFVLPLFLGTGCLHFDLKTVRFYTTKSSRLKFFFSVVFYTTFAIFICFRTGQVFKKNGSSDPNFPISSAFCFVFVLEAATLALLNWTQDDLALLYTRVVRYCIRFEKEWMTSYNPGKSLTGLGLDLCIIAAVMFFLTIPWATVFHYLLYPQTPIFLPTLLPPEWRDNPWIYWGYVVVPAFYATAVWQNFAFMVVIILVYVFSVTPLINTEFRIGATGQKSDRSLRTTANLPLQYRGIDLMHKPFLEIMGIQLFNMQAGFGQFILFANVAAISNKNLDVGLRAILIIWSITLQLVLVVALELSGRFTVNGKKTCASWKNMEFASKAEKKYMSKFRRSCRPLKMGTDGVTTVKPLAVLKFLRAITKGTFKALVIGRK